MFGLLDSVKKALDLKCSQEEEHKIHNGNYGEKATQSVFDDIKVWACEVTAVFLS